MARSTESDGPRLASQIEEASRHAELRVESLHAQRRGAAYAQRADAISMLAHELRNPLNVVASVLGLMRLKNRDCEQLRVIERQLDYMTRLINDLLDASRIDRGKLLLRKRRVLLAEVVAGAVEMLAPIIEQRRQRLKVSVPASLYVQVDPSRMTQVVANLLDNAAKFSGSGARIIVRAGRRSDGTVRLAVIDEGAGIDPRALPKVFELYSQSVPEDGGGLGIGLAVVRGIVGLHGGEVRAYSAGLGKGSRFVVELPESEPPLARA